MSSLASFLAISLGRCRRACEQFLQASAVVSDGMLLSHNARVGTAKGDSIDVVDDAPAYICHEIFLLIRQHVQCLAPSVDDDSPPGFHIGR